MRKVTSGCLSTVRRHQHNLELADAVGELVRGKCLHLTTAALVPLLDFVCSDRTCSKHHDDTCAREVRQLLEGLPDFSAPRLDVYSFGPSKLSLLARIEPQTRANCKLYPEFRATHSSALARVLAASVPQVGGAYSRNRKPTPVLSCKENDLTGSDLKEATYYLAHSVLFVAKLAQFGPALEGWKKQEVGGVTSSVFRVAGQKHEAYVGGLIEERSDGDVKWQLEDTIDSCRSRSVVCEIYCLDRFTFPIAAQIGFTCGTTWQVKSKSKPR